MKKFSVFLILSILIFSSAISYSTETVVGKTVPVQEGDIIIYAQEAVEPNQPEYFSQMYLAFFQTMGKAAGEYDSFGDLRTWDGTKYPLGKRNFCGHAEIALKNKDYEIPEDWNIVVLRPTELMRSLVNINEVVKKAREVYSTEISYNQPFIYLLIKWIKNNGIGWENKTLFARWKESYNIDFENIEPRAAQYSPNLGTDIHNDIGHPDFFKRDLDCSGGSAWLIIWYGYYTGSGGEEFREWLRDTPEGEDLANATDCLAPGQLGWWLEYHGFAEIVLIARYRLPLFPFTE